MKILGVALAAVGVVTSTLTLLHDLLRMRLSLIAPQAAPSRYPPELHAIAAILNAAGWMVLRGWRAGSIVLFVHLTVAYVLAPRLVQRLAILFSSRGRTL